MTEIEIIEKILKRKDITKEKLSRMIKMSSTGMYDIFKRGDMKVSVLRKIADALNVNPCVFFKNDEFDEKNIINGSYNNIGISNSINIENESLKREIKLLKKTIKDKEQIIELLTKNK